MKYLKISEEFRNQTAEFIIENNRSATSVAEELGILWVKDDSNFFMFFENYSSKDMVWDYFSFTDLKHIVINS